MKVSIDRNRLIETLKSNREKHEREYKAAKVGYRATLMTMFADCLKRLEDGHDSEHGDIFSLHKPSHYLKDYDRAIAMFEMAQEESIVLDDEDFQKLVLDDWEWKSRFSTVNSGYIK